MKWQYSKNKALRDACEPWGYVAPVVAAVMTRATGVRHIYLIVLCYALCFFGVLDGPKQRYAEQLRNSSNKLLAGVYMITSLLSPISIINIIHYTFSQAFQAFTYFNPWRVSAA